MEQTFGTPMGLCGERSGCSGIYEAYTLSRQILPRKSKSTIAQAIAMTADEDLSMTTLYHPWHLNTDYHLRWPWDSSQQGQGGIDGSLLVHEGVGIAAWWNAAEQLSTLDQRRVIFDNAGVESHAKCVLEKFGSDEASDKCCGRTFTSESAGYLPAPRECMEIVNDRKSSPAHAHVFDGGLEHHIQCDDSFISGRGELQDVCSTLDRSTTTDVTKWDAVVQSYCDKGQHEDALQLLNYMLHVGVQPSTRTFASIFTVLPDEDMLEKGRSLHFCITKSGRKMNTFVGNLLIRMYVKIGSLKDARTVFDELPHKDTVTWNLMIGGYNQHDDDQQALVLFHQMVHFGIQPNVITFLNVLRACSSMGALEQGKDVHLYMVESGLDTVVSVGATLIDMYAKCGNLEVARTIFNRSPVRDLVTWSVLISGYSNYGNSKEAVQLYDRLQGEGLKPDRIICVCVLKAYSDVAALDPGRDLHSYVIEMGLELDVTVSSALIEMYTKCGVFDDSSVTFSRLERQDVVLWSVCMARFVETGRSQEALELFEKMQQVRIEPDKVTFISILNACSSLAALDQGKQVHSHVIGHGLELDLSVGSALIDMYMKSGSLLDALTVFHKLGKQDVVTWSALTAGYVQYGRFEEALELYLLMQHEGMKPNQVGYLYLLSKSLLISVGIK